MTKDRERLLIAGFALILILFTVLIFLLRGSVGRGGR
jgi:hypothetical protein